MIKDCLGPTPSHKERFFSFIFELGHGTHPLQSVIQECKRKYPLKEQNAAGSGTTEPSAPPYENNFSHKIRIQSKDDSDSNSVSDKRVKWMLQSIKHWEPCIWGYLHRPRDFLLLLRVPCRLHCRQLIVKERIQLVFNFTLCLRDQTLTTLACNKDFMKKFHLKL
jgi:hypothetical protein